MQRRLKILITIGILLMVVAGAKGFQNTPKEPKLVFEHHKVYYIGKKNSFANVVLATAYEGQLIVPRTPEEIEKDSIVVFDSEMLGSPQAKEYIREALSKGCWIVSIGGNNSGLMDMIFQRGVYLGPSDEEKKRMFLGQFNAPVVGFRLVKEGNYEYPSYFVSNTDNPREIMEGIYAWITGELLRG